jgi:hypothetical protein
MSGFLINPEVVLRLQHATRGALGIALLGLTPAITANTAVEADEITLTLPDGFSASVFHPGVGKGARHLAIRDNGEPLRARWQSRPVSSCIRTTSTSPTTSASHGSGLMTAFYLTKMRKLSSAVSWNRAHTPPRISQ